MKIIDMLPTMDDSSLQNIFDNANRIISENTGKMHAQATELLPHIVAERDRRRQITSAAAAERARAGAAKQKKARSAASAAKKKAADGADLSEAS